MDTDINIPDSYFLYLTYTLIITHRDNCDVFSMKRYTEIQGHSAEWANPNVTGWKRYVEFNFVAVESMDSNIKEFQFLKLNNIYIYCDCN